MLDQSEHKKVPYDEHPDRCQSTVNLGEKNGQKQCPYMKMPGSEYCDMHGGNSEVEARQKAAVRMYKIAQWQQRIGEFADNQGIKSLREEIGVLRLLLEEKLNQCKSSNDLMMRASSIGEIVTKIQKLVESCDRMDKSTGSLLDKEATIALGQGIISLVANYLKDADILQKFAGELLSLIKNTNDPLAERNRKLAKVN